MDIDRIFTKAEQAQSEVAELASGLVKINTAHPEGRTDESVAFIQRYCSEHSIACEVHANDPQKPNIVIKAGGDAKRTAMWMGHLDVVPAGEADAWTHPPFSGTIEDGMVYGRGSSDMKGACAAAMVAARILNEVDEGLPNNAAFWFTSDEEIGGAQGALWLAESGRLEGDVCVIGDGNGGGMEMPSVDLGCKGALPTKLISKGKTAHGSVPFIGDNALSKLLQAIPAIEKIGELKLDYPEELRETTAASIQFAKAILDLTPEQEAAADRLFDYPTVACTMLNAGVKINVVPDYAEASFDIRLTPGIDPARVRERIINLLREAGVAGVEAEVQPKAKVGYFESPASPFAAQLTEAVEMATGGKSFYKLLTGGTDGIRVSGIAGIPSLGYGTSLAGQAHQPNEHVSISNLILGVKVYAAFPLIYAG